MGGPFVEWVCHRRKAPADVCERSSQVLCDRREFLGQSWRLASTRQQPRSSADRFVARPALLERLSAAAPGTVTVVCAPAGSGKTVLLRSWAAEADVAVAWV